MLFDANHFQILINRSQESPFSTELQAMHVEKHLTGFETSRRLIIAMK